MKRLAGIAARLCLWIAAAIGCCTGPARATQPNIVVIVSDDAGYDGFGFSAALNNISTPMETPNLDALAQQSVVLRQGYAAAPVCGTSRAGLLTGRYQQEFGFE